MVFLCTNLKEADMKVFLFSKCMDGYLLSLGARHLSQHTIDDYTRTLTKFAKFLDEDYPVTQITSQHIENFLASYKNLSNKSLLNYFVGLSSLWTWLVNEGIVKTNIVRKLKPPKAERKEVVPLTESEVKAIMAAPNRSRVYVRQGQNVDHSLGSFERNRAIILLMLNTGMRASELCDLKIEDVDNRNNRIFVRQGKGMKERMLPFSPRTGQMIWRYLAAREHPALGPSVRRPAESPDHPDQVGGDVRRDRQARRRAQCSSAPVPAYLRDSILAQWRERLHPPAYAGPFDSGNCKNLSEARPGGCGSDAPARIAGG
jgi:site-specific recombinase XerD